MSSDYPSSTPPVPAQIAPGTPTQMPAPIVIYQSGGRLGRIFSGLGWTGFIICLFSLLSLVALRHEYFDTTHGVQEKFVSGSETATDKIAIITVSGVILEGESSFVKHQIERVRKDDNVKAIVLRVDSPGGTVTGSDYLFHHLKKLKKEKDIPLVVSMGSMAASGGYYVAMAVGDQKQAIYAEPTTTTGSIGVIIPHYDISGLLARFDVKDDSVASHPRKQILSMTKPMAPQDRELIQGWVNESFERFKTIINEGRPNLAKESLNELATGEIFSAQKAKTFGLVDEIGFQEDAIDRAIALAELESDHVRVVKYEAEPTLLGAAGFAQAPSAPASEISALMELSVPRAWYIATDLPPLVSSQRQ